MSQGRKNQSRRQNENSRDNQKQPFLLFHRNHDLSPTTISRTVNQKQGQPERLAILLHPFSKDLLCISLLKRHYKRKRLAFSFYRCIFFCPFRHLNDSASFDSTDISLDINGMDIGFTDSINEFIFLPINRTFAAVGRWLLGAYPPKSILQGIFAQQQ